MADQKITEVSTTNFAPENTRYFAEVDGALRRIDGGNVSIPTMQQTIGDIDQRVTKNTSDISQLSSDLDDITTTFTRYSVFITENKEYILSCSQLYQLFCVIGQKGIIGTFNDMNGNALQKTIIINGVIDNGNNSLFKIVENGAKHIKLTLSGNTGIWICSSKLFSIN